MKYKSNSDASLLILVSRGDEQAFVELVRRYWDKTYFYAISFLKSTVEAEDFTQEIFLKIWTARKELAEVEQFSNYLFIVSRNRLVSEFRKKKIRAVPLQEVVAEETWVPDKQLEAKLLAALLAEGIQRLTIQQRAVYERVTNLQMKYGDIAIELGISKRTVRFHMASALGSIREFINRHSCSY